MSGTRAAAQAPDSEGPGPAAVEPVEPQVPGAAPRDLDIRWSADQRYTFKADFDGPDVDQQRYGMSVRLTKRLSPELAFRFTTNWHASIFDFHGPTDLIPGIPQSAPFETLYRTQMVAAALYRLGRGWSIAGGALGRSSLESGANFDDSLVGGGFFAVGWEFRKRLELGAGVQVKSRLQDNEAGISPIARLRWNVTDSIRLQTSGRGLRIRYRPSKALAFSVYGRFEGESYRLDAKGPPLGAGTLQVRQVPVGAGVVWRPLQGIKLELDAGAMVHQKLRVRDKNDNESNSISADPAPFFGTRIQIRF